jgi:predicted metal-dependent hydrolase
MMRQEDNSPLVVAFVADLMFTTKIENVIRGLGYRVEWIAEDADIEGEYRSSQNLPGEPLDGKTGRLFELVTAWQPGLLLFDLANTAVPWQRWIPLLKSSAATRRIPILAFGPHTNVDLMQEATRLGADAVLARSRFTADMPTLLQQYTRTPDFEAIHTACEEPLAPLARSGIEKFNQGQFYACHDDLEEAWRQDAGPARDLYRGILQVGIAYYQIERGNYRGAVKMLLRVRQWLDPLPDTCRGVNVKRLRDDAADVYEALTAVGPEQLDTFDRGLFKPVHVNGF